MGKSRIKDKNYCTIQGWMITELDLSGSELIAYAVIYGFSQEEDQYMTCSQQYIADWRNMSRSKCNELLKRLEEKKLIIKRLIGKNGAVKKYEYKALIPERPVNSTASDAPENNDSTSSDAINGTSYETEHAERVTKRNTSSYETEHATSYETEHAASYETEHNNNSIYIKNNKDHIISYLEDYESYIKKQIEYGILCHDMPHDIELLDEIVLAIMDVYSSNAKTLRVNEENKPTEIVKSYFSKIDMEHIKYVLAAFKNYNGKINNTRSFMRTVLYNSVSTMKNHYTNLVNYNNHGESG